jgi:hypothetical protein
LLSFAFHFRAKAIREIGKIQDRFVADDRTTRRTMKRTITIGLAIAALMSAAFAYYEDQHRPLPQHGYADVQLSDSKDEVKYRIGNPDNVIPDECTQESFGCVYQMYRVDGTDPKNTVPKGKTDLPLAPEPMAMKHACSPVWPVML